MIIIETFRLLDSRADLAILCYNLFSSLVSLDFSALLSGTTRPMWKQMKILQYCQRQKCSPGTLVSGVALARVFYDCLSACACGCVEEEVGSMPSVAGRGRTKSFHWSVIWSPSTSHSGHQRQLQDRPNAMLQKLRYETGVYYAAVLIGRITRLARPSVRLFRTGSW